MAIRRPIFIDNQSIAKDKKYSFLSGDIAAGVSSISVESIVGFATGQPILIGNIGSGKSEIILTSGSPSGDTISLASATVEAHSRGDKVTILDYNQIEISWEASITPDSDTILATIDIQAGLPQSIYNDTVKTSGYYFTRYKNSSDTSYSDYSDPIPYAGYASNSVFAIKERALNDLGESVDDKLITNDYLNESLWEGRRDLDNDKRILHWSFRQKFNQNIGSITPGEWKVAVPTDLRDPNTYKNILGIRIGRKGRKLDYIDMTEFNQKYVNFAHTTLNGAVTTGDLTITLTDSGDFDESGTLSVAGTTIDSISYTSNNESTGVVSGVTGIVASGHLSGTDVWQEITFGEPTAFTIHDGYIYFDCPFEDDLADENIYMDYWGKLVEYDSDADVLDEPEVDMFVSWLKWKIKYKLKSGDIDKTKDTDYQDWLIRKDNLISKELNGQEINFYPDY
jgi:hypothetical protein